MNKIKHIMISVGLMALTGSASAGFIYEQDTPLSEYSDLIQEIIDGVYTENRWDEKRSITLGKKMKKYHKKLDRIEIHPENTERLTERAEHTKTRMYKILGKFLARHPDIPVPDGGSNQEDGEGSYENIPEPSTIALLGLGLLGIGAARRLRKRSS